MARQTLAVGITANLPYHFTPANTMRRGRRSSNLCGASTPVPLASHRVVRILHCLSQHQHIPAPSLPRDGLWTSKRTRVIHNSLQTPATQAYHQAGKTTPSWPRSAASQTCRTNTSATTSTLKSTKTSRKICARYYGNSGHPSDTHSPTVPASLVRATPQAVVLTD